MESESYAMEMSRFYSSAIQATNSSEVKTEENCEGLIFISEISSGAFGTVWVGRYNGQSVAIKKIECDEKPKDQLEFVQGMIDEARTMKEMNHERVVKFMRFVFKFVF
mgnify:CR=1 FL=1